MTEPTTAITKAYEPRGAAMGEAKLMKAMLASRKEEFSSLVPAGTGLNVERIFASALQAVCSNRTLLKCTDSSILIAVNIACEFGLCFAKQLGQAYLVPIKNVCELWIGYRGMMDLARRAAGVHRFESDVVYKGDLFTITKGSEPKLIHEPNLGTPRDPGQIVGAYSIAYFDDDAPVFEWMQRVEIDNIRGRSRGGNSGPWVTDFGAMARKTVIRRAIKYLPISVEYIDMMTKMLEHDDRITGLSNGPVIDVDANTSELKSTLDALEQKQADDAPEDKTAAEIAIDEMHEDEDGA